MSMEACHRKQTLLRLKCFRAIFEQLKGREFGVQDVSKVIGMTHSGTRRYRRELLELDLMHQTCLGFGGCVMYRLTENQHDIAAFLSLVADGEQLVAPMPTKRRPVDVIPVRQPFVAFRDEMVAAFFGPARAAGAA